MGSRARGVATVDDTVAESELERLTDGGIRGARFHMLTGRVLPWEILAEVCQRP
ncbi:MAG: hypothetical protein V3U93_02960 [Alphaproteobacteria bacterium]